MEWLKALLGTVVGLDTAPLIYFIEKHPKYTALIHPFFEAVESGDIEVVTSILTLTEVLVHPLRQGNQGLAAQYSKILLNARHLTTLPVSLPIAVKAAGYPRWVAGSCVVVSGRSIAFQCRTRCCPAITR